MRFVAFIHATVLITLFITYFMRKKMLKKRMAVEPWLALLWAVSDIVLVVMALTR